MKTILILLIMSALAPLAFLPAAAPPARPDPAIEDAHDFVVLHPSRPYRVRLHLRAAGRPYQADWNQQVAHMFRFLDADGDGVLSKAEASRARSREQWQQLTAGSAQLDPDAAPVFGDLARGKATATLDDLRAYYSSSTAGPLSMNWASRGSPSDPLSEALFGILDTNRDGKLSRAELQAARRVLNRLDADEDEMVSPSEIMGRGFADPGPASQRGQAHGLALGRLPFFSLRPGQPAAPLARALITRYDRNGDGKLSQDEIGLDAKVFSRLDRDGDGKLDAAELAGWTSMTADLEVEVPLAGERTIRLTSGKSAALGTQPTHEGLLVVVRDWCLELRLGRAQLPPPAQRVAAARDLFRGLDKNSNGYLESAEVFQPPFAYVAWMRLADRDGDGRVSRNEFVAFADVRRKVQGALTFVRVQDMGRSLFHLLDSDRDGRLGQRELRDAWKQLQAWNVSGTDGFRRETLPYHYRLTMGQGAADPPERLLGTEQISRSTRGPLWFRKMDRNGDGDVSRAEWLGSEEQFRAIDTDGDGLISVAEAEAYDKRTRAKTKK